MKIIQLKYDFYPSFHINAINKGIITPARINTVYARRIYGVQCVIKKDEYRFVLFLKEIV